MKKINLLLLVALFTTIITHAQNAYNNCFTNDFDPNAVGRHDKNAYLLCYLACATYADIITQFDEPNATIASLETLGAALQKNETQFMTKFKKVMAPLMFANVNDANTNTFLFNVDGNNTDGYDPEAILVNTPNAIFISWRGTDRVQSRNGIDYEVREWWQTNFMAVPYSPGAPQVGKVHQGAWLSIMKIANSLATKIEELGGKTKKVWITGHSLGAGQAQLFASYLNKVKQIKAQGVVTFATPQFGDAVFNADLETSLGGKERIQRFDFIDDPISCIAQVIPDFKPNGTRNLYTNINNCSFATAERTAGEIIRIATSIPSGLFNVIPNPALSGGFCFHHQHWYLKSAFNQLNNSQKARMPAPLDVNKIVKTFCGSVDIARANGGGNGLQGIVARPIEAVLQLADDGIDAANDALHNFGNLLNNFTANQLDQNYTGFYRIKNLYTGKYIAVPGRCDGANACKFIQWAGNDVGANAQFKIEQYTVAGLNFGYAIKLRGTNAVIDVDGWHVNENIQLQTWSKNAAPTPNQAWGFYKVGTSNTKFIIQNRASGKVMDIKGGYTINGKEITQNPYVKDRGVQVWVLEKVN